VLSVAGGSSSTSTQNITGPPLMQGRIGISFSTLDVGRSTPTMPSVGGLTSTQHFSGSSPASSIDIPHAPPSTPTNIGVSCQHVPAAPTPGLYQSYMCLYVY